MPLRLEDIANSLATSGVDQSFCFPAHEYAKFKTLALDNIKRGFTTALITSVTVEPEFPIMNFNKLPYVIDVYVLQQDQVRSIVSVYSPNINDKVRNK